MKKTISILVAISIIVSVIPMGVINAVNIDLRNKGITDEMLAEMVESGEISLNVTELLLNGNEITNIEPLKKLASLKWLDLIDNRVADVTPLSGLVNLTTLRLSGNEITDISPLSELKKMEHLHLDSNYIIDITALSEMTKLEALGLGYNQIVDISPISELREIKALDLSHNQIQDVTPLHWPRELWQLDIRDNLISLERVRALENSFPDDERPGIYHNARPTPGHVLGNLDITIFDALEILKYIVGIDNVIDNDAMALEAALIVSDDVPGIFDVLEVLKYLVGMESEAGMVSV